MSHQHDPVMVERMARALRAEQCAYVKVPPDWESLPDKHRDEYREWARTALAALLRLGATITMKGA